MKYVVVDFYEGAEIVGKAETIREAVELARQYQNDTDGECTVRIGEVSDYAYDTFL